jgi:periplasmic divalent cation tolerance protein
MTEARVVLVTVPSREEGERIAEVVVGECLAACVNIVGPIRSIYRWQGQVCRDDEHLLLLKTCRDRYGELETRILELHPYDVPEVIALPVDEGAMPYLSWIHDQTRAV